MKLTKAGHAVAKQAVQSYVPARGSRFARSPSRFQTTASEASAAARVSWERSSRSGRDPVGAVDRTHDPAIGECSGLGDGYDEARYEQATSLTDTLRGRATGGSTITQQFIKNPKKVGKFCSEPCRLKHYKKNDKSMGKNI